MTRDEAWLCGYFLGDGSCAMNGSGVLSPCIYGQDGDEKVVFAALGKDLKIVSKRSAWQAYLPKDSRGFLEKGGLLKKVDCYTKSVSEEIRNFNLGLKAEVVAGYWDADGGVKLYESDRLAVTANSVSKNLMEGIQYLLRCLGFELRVDTYHNGEYADRHRIVVPKEMQQRWLQTIPTRIKRV